MPLIELRAWPGTESWYALSGTAKDPQLAVTVSAQPGHALPGPAESAGQAVLRAAEQAERYRLICSQLAEADVSVLTSLDPGRPMPIASGALALRRLAEAGALSAQAAAAARQPELAGIATVGELLDRYGLLVEHLAAVNADQPLNRLLAAGQPLAMRTGQIEPDTVPADPSTLAQVAARLRVTAQRLLEDNRGLRLAAEPEVALPGTVTLPAGARTPYLTQPGDTLAALAPRFGTTAREIVAGNAGVDGLLPPGIPVEISVEVAVEPGVEGGGQAAVETVTASTDTVAGDSFRSVCDRLTGQHADITLDAVADELDRLGAVLTAGLLLNCPLAVLGGGRGDEGPLTAAEVQAAYGCPPAAFAAANAAVLGILQPGVRLGDGSNTTTTTADDTLNAVLDRLAADASLASITRVLSANAAAQLFRPGAQALLPVPPVTVTATPGQALGATAAAVPLVVTLRLERPAEAAPGHSAAEHADSAVPATRERDALVDSFLTVLPSLRLATDAENRLWAVSFGESGIAEARIAPAGSTGPHAFAPRPLYHELVDFSAWIRPVTSAGTLGTPTRQHYRAVSVEPWARSFLADLDGYLQEPFRTRLPEAARASLLGIRRRLADAVADGLAPVLRDPAAQSPAALRNARIAVASLGRDGLAEIHQASVVGQYEAVVAAPHGAAGRASARLVGTLTSAGRPDVRLSSSRIELDPSNATCTFAVTSTDPAEAIDVSIQPVQVVDAMELGSSVDDAGTEPLLLRFVRPLTGGYLPAAVVAELPPAALPVPLREHPSPVSAQPMTAEATFAGAAQPTLAEAAQWTASLTYTHEHTAHDVIALTWSEPVPAAATPAPTALAEALAAYTAAAADLAQLLGSRADPVGDAPADPVGGAATDPAGGATADPAGGTAADPADDADAAALRDNAGAALVELAAAVAAAWSQHWTSQEPVAAEPAGALPSQGYRLRALCTAGQHGRRLDRLVVSRTRAEDSWPVITLGGPGQQVPLAPGPITDETREYVPAAHPIEADQLTFRLDWPGLRGAPRPDARIGLVAVRNTVLRDGAPTSPAFVLASPVRQVDIAPPSVRWPQELPLHGATVAEALQNAFDVLGGEQPGGARLSVEVGYAEQVGELHTVLPVLLVSELVPAPDSAGAIAARLEEWRRRYQPATAGAQWRLRLALLSAHPGEPPLLTFDQLVVPVVSS